MEDVLYNVISYSGLEGVHQFICNYYPSNDEPSKLQVANMITTNESFFDYT